LSFTIPSGRMPLAETIFPEIPVEMPDISDPVVPRPTSVIILVEVSTDPILYSVL